MLKTLREAEDGLAVRLRPCLTFADIQTENLGNSGFDQ